MSTTVGFIGLGLIGGSIAKALKKSDNTIYTIAYNRSKAPLTQAVADKVIDEAAWEIGEAFGKCDIIFLCTPVEYNSVYLEKVSKYISDGCIITDVGSVKGYIHKTVKELSLEANFIGGHPMAGSEKTGYDASSELILENAYFAVTPTSKTTQDKIDFYISLIEQMGAIPIVADPDTHDYAVAGISHVPHLIASGLVNMVRENDTPDELMKTLAAGGFKDITRIASSSPEMWSQICKTNKEQILIILQKYIDYMNLIKEYVESENKDAIYTMFEESREYRNSISIRTKGSLIQSHTIYCDIEDKEGALSSITTFLSDCHISIKNIEIIHNREYKQGALLIDFYDEDAKRNALTILKENGYTIYK